MMTRADIKLPILAACTLILAAPGVLLAQDTDGDGMSNNYEVFFGLNPTNAADALLDYDGDALTNRQEAAKWTDPWTEDTDLDAWWDNWDGDPLSRAVYYWGASELTTGNGYRYTGPAWCQWGYKVGSSVWSNGWFVAPTSTATNNYLRMDFSRALLTNNSLRMDLYLYDHRGASLYLDLLATNGASITNNLLGNLVQGTNQTRIARLTVPLGTNLSAKTLQLRRAAGEVRVYGTILYVDRDGDGLDDAQEAQIGSSPTNNSSPAMIPGKVEAEDFNSGGEGVAYHDTTTANEGGQYRTTEGVDIEACSDTNGGYNVGYTKAGEWMDYIVNVVTAGWYSIAVRVANAEAAGGLFHLEINGDNVTGPMTMSGTGGWQVWQDVVVTNIFLYRGAAILTLAMDSQASGSNVGNYNSIRFTLTRPYVNNPPRVTVTGDTAVFFPTAARLNAAVSDDGVPTNTLYGGWRQVTGPMAATFTNTQTLSTSVSFPVPGTYVVRLLADDTEFAGWADLTVTSVPAQAPTVSWMLINDGAASTTNRTAVLNNACAYSPTQYIASESIAFTGTAWQVYSTAPTFLLSTGAGTKTVYFKVRNAYGESAAASDTIQYAPANQAPTASAGPDQTITSPASATLAGTVTDDGLPSNKLTASWTKVSGPGTVTFTNAATANTRASFSTNGVYVLRLTASDTALTASDDVQVTVNPTVQPGNVNGLTGVYFAGMDLVTQRLTRIDPQINFDWGSGTPSNGVLDADYFSVRWTGWVEAPSTETYTFTTRSDDGVRLWVNGQLLVDQWIPQSPTEWSGTIALQAGQRYAITMEYYEQAGGAVAQLQWSSASIAKQIIPTERLWTTALPPPVNQAPTANAGSDQTITLPASAVLAGTVSDDGLPSNRLTASWAKVSGPGTVTFTNATTANTQASFSTNGVYVLRLTASDTALTASDDVQVTVNAAAPVNQAPTANAGPDQAITPPASAVLAGTVSDDGLPSNRLTASWAKVSGPGTVTFTNAATANTRASFSAEGVYVLRLTASDTALTASDDVQITVNTASAWVKTNTVLDRCEVASFSNNNGTVNWAASWVEIGESNGASSGYVRNRYLDLSGYRMRISSDSRGASRQADLSGCSRAEFSFSYRRSGLDNTNDYVTVEVSPNGGATWTRLVRFDGSGNDSAYVAAVYDITAYASANTQIRFLSSTALGVSDYLYLDDIQILFTKTNRVPVVDAGPNATITLPASAGLNGTATDDGLPNATLTFAWSKASGPGAVTFANPASLATTASFSTGGVYVLQLVASDGLASATDTVSVTANQSPVVSAGANQLITLPASAALTGSVSDDGLPSNKVMVTWAKASGPGNVTFSNATLAVTTASFSTGGVYVLSLTASDGLSSVSNTTTVTVNNRPPAYQQSGYLNALVTMETETFSTNLPVNGYTWSPTTSPSGYSGSNALVALPNNGTNIDTGYVTASPRLDFLINFRRTGTHYVWVRGLGASGNDDSCHAGLDGVAVSTADRITGFGTNWTWSDSTADGPLATVVVSNTGLHTLNIWMREDGFVLDKITITTNGYTPSGLGPPVSERAGSSADTDGDGVSDWEETNILGSNPALVDTDGDGLQDAVDPRPTVTNVPPTISAVGVASTNNFHSGTPVTVSATAMDADGDPLQYQFYMDGSVFRSWASSSSASWSPGTNGVGSHTARVAVRDTLTASNELSRSLYMFRLPPTP